MSEIKEIRRIFNKKWISIQPKNKGLTFEKIEFLTILMGYKDHFNCFWVLSDNSILNYTYKNCKQLNTTNLYIYTKHLVIYWILPFVSYGKKARTKCDYCKIELKKKKFNEELLLSFQNHKIDAKIPIWHSTGVILIALLFTPVLISLIKVMFIS